MNLKNKMKYLHQKQEEYNCKILGLGQNHSKLTKEEKDEVKKRAMEERDKYEATHCGNYKKIYPDETLQNKYDEYVLIANKAWNDYHGYNIKKMEEKSIINKTKFASKMFPALRINAKKNLESHLQPRATSNLSGIRTHKEISAKKSFQLCSEDSYVMNNSKLPEGNF